MGLSQAFGELCVGVTAGLPAVSATIVTGYMNNFNSIAGYARVLSASVSVFFLTFGGGVVNCCTHRGWRGCSPCGGFSEFGVAFGPGDWIGADASNLLCHTWMAGRPTCFMAANSRGCPACFPSDAVVQTPRGEKAMQDLRAGDKVLTASKSGALTFEDVYFFGHADPKAVSQFVELTLEGAKKPLELSEQHFVPLCPISGKTCKYEERVYKYARETVRGDYLWLAGAKGAIELARVEKTGAVLKGGKFNPYTMGGSIVVNGVLASAHSNWVLDDHVPEWATGYLPYIYQAAFAPFRVLYAAFGAAAADASGTNSPMQHDHYSLSHGTDWAVFSGCLLLQLSIAVGLAHTSVKAARRYL